MATNRIPAFDLLNIIACIAVVFLHQNGAVHKFNDCAGWYVSLFFECIFYFAVPVFFMLSGASLMRFDERYGIREFFKRRLKRTLVPFLLWSFIWLGLMIAHGNISIKELSLLSIFDGIINTKFQPIYWFFIPLFMIYLMMPMLTICKENKSLIKYLIIFFFVVSSVYPLLGRVFNLELNHFIACDLFGPLLYALCGYYFYRWSYSNKILYSVIILGIISIIVRYYITAELSFRAGITDRILFGYYLPTAIFPSLAVYLLISKQKIRLNDRIKSKLAQLASLSLGVYLLHKLVITFELKFLSRFSISEYSISWLIVMPIITYTICIFIVMFVKKFKIGNYIFP